MARKLAGTGNGRVVLLLEPRDCWVGGYWDDRYIYLTLIPCFPLRIRYGSSES